VVVMSIISLWPAWSATHAGPTWSDPSATRAATATDAPRGNSIGRDIRRYRRVKPTMEIYCDNAQPWVQLGEEIKRFGKAPG
jgi:hypothetical protein